MNAFELPEELAVRFGQLVRGVPGLAEQVTPDLLTVAGMVHYLSLGQPVSAGVLVVGRDAFSRLIVVAEQLGCSEIAQFLYVGYEMTCHDLAVLSGQM